LPPCGDAIGYVLEQFENSDPRFSLAGFLQNWFPLKMNDSKIGTEIHDQIHLALCLSELSAPLKNSCVQWFPQNSTINGYKHTTDGPEVARILREQFCTYVAT
jgi:hypothetical protein